MRNKSMYSVMPLDLQFFAGDLGGGDGGGTGSSSVTGDAGTKAGGNGAGDDGKGAAGAPGEGDDGKGAAGAPGEGKPQGFDDFLKDPKMQAEFDRRVNKALETSKTKMQAEIEAQIANARTEAEKLAKMNAEEKAKYEQQKKEGELAAREAEITKRELTAQAKETLADKGLPVSLADILNYTDASTCQASIEAVEKAFQEAVAKGVEDKLKGGSPMKKAPESGGTFTREQISAMNPEEINKNWDAVQASMKNLR